MNMVRTVCALVLVSFTLFPLAGSAQQPRGELSGTYRAEVVRVLESELVEIPGTGTERLFQTIEARLLEGEAKGDIITVNNDYLALTRGDKLFVLHYTDFDGTAQYSVQDVDRRGALVVLLILFVAGIVALGGWYGVRALISLAASLFVLAYVLVPGLLAGWPPLLTCFVVATAVLGGAIFLTHGWNRESLIAFGGTLAAVAFTLVLAAWSVSFAHLSGFSADESVALNFNTRGALDIVALLVGGIIIGALGVLDDVAITQVSVVRELLAGHRERSRKEVFFRAMRVGREHVGAVINTLALAYVGVSLPLVLLMHLSPASGSALFNMEIFATEIVRTVVGSFGIILAVPLVTLLAVWYLPRDSDGGAAHVHGRTTG